MHQSLNLEEHSLKESHTVTTFPGQKTFFVQNWSIHFSPLINWYISPYYSHSCFKIIFGLFFDEKGNTKLYGKLVPQNSFDSFKIFLRIGNPNGSNITVNQVWSFKFKNRSNRSDIAKLNKSQIINNGFLDDEGKLNIYIELSYYVRVQFMAQQRARTNIRNNLGRIGLQNLGSICYMNSSLQILFHIPELRTILYSCDSSTDKKVLFNIQYLFYSMENSTVTCSAMDLHNSIKFCLDEQNTHKDACEFIIKLKDALDGEISGTSQDKDLNDLFQISVRSNIECFSKSYKKSQIEYYQFLNIHFGDDTPDTPLNLIDCLLNFQKKSDIVHSTDEYGKQPAVKWDEFITFPPVLGINFIRFTYDAKKRNYVKCNRLVEFNETIDLSQFSHIENDLFELYAILIHYGEIEGGHYYSLIQDFDTKKWYKYDNSVISLQDPNKPLLTSEIFKLTYLLFYVRKSEKERLFAKCTICEKTKNFLLKIQAKKEIKTKRENMLTFRFILEDELNSPQPLNKGSILSEKSLMIDKNRTNLQLYEEVAKLFDKKPSEIRLWETDVNNIKKKLKENSSNSEIKAMHNNTVLFVQNKKESENLIPYIENDRFDNIDYMMVFVKYFDTRMKVPIRYIGPLIVEENSCMESAQICSLLDFPETTKFHFFVEFMPLAATHVSTLCSYKSAAIIEGTTIIVQVDLDSTETHSLPDLSKSKVLNGVELNNTSNNSNNDENNSANVNETSCNENNSANANETSCNENNSANVNETSCNENNSANVNETSCKNSRDVLNVPNYKAVDFLKDKKLDLLDHYLALRNHMNHYLFYDYEDQAKPSFTLDFPASFTLSDICEIIKEVNHFESRDCIHIFDKYADSDSATRNYVPEQRFQTKVYERSFPGDRIYYFNTPGITSFANKSVYIVQVAADGYNVTYTKTIVGPTQTTPAEVLVIASKEKGFPEEIEIPQVVFDVAAKKENKPENTTPDKTHFMIYDVNKSQIIETLMMSDFLNLTFHTIRFCTFIPPEKDEVNVLVCHATVNEKRLLNFIKIPFYMNLKKNLSVKEFKEKVLKCVNVEDKEQFMNAKLENMTKDSSQSSGKYLINNDDQLTNLTSNSAICIIYS